MYSTDRSQGDHVDCRGKSLKASKAISAEKGRSIWLDTAIELLDGRSDDPRIIVVAVGTVLAAVVQSEHWPRGQNFLLGTKGHIALAGIICLLASTGAVRLSSLFRVHPPGFVLLRRHPQRTTTKERRDLET
eukprot:scaffold34612_cov165-Amphora_coffeaeformis.AAC.12